MKRSKFMNHLMTAALGATLACGPGIAAAQQTSPNQSNSSQEKQDVPQGNREEKSPDIKTQHAPKPSSPGTGNTDHTQNVPHPTPGSNNPDLQQQRKPAAKKKSKKSKGTAPPSSQPSGNPRL
jgi:hypothetical protein